MSEQSQKFLIPGSEAENDKSFGGIPIVYSEEVPKNELWVQNPDGTVVKFQLKKEKQ